MSQRSEQILRQRSQAEGKDAKEDAPCHQSSEKRKLKQGDPLHTHQNGQELGPWGPWVLWGRGGPGVLPPCCWACRRCGHWGGQLGILFLVKLNTLSTYAPWHSPPNYIGHPAKGKTEDTVKRSAVAGVYWWGWGWTGRAQRMFRAVRMFCVWADEGCGSSLIQTDPQQVQHLGDLGHWVAMGPCQFISCDKCDIWWGCW